LKFIKPPRSIEEQITLLQQRGLYISNYDQAFHYLKYVSYYRLRAYWLPFEKESQSLQSHLFQDNTSFQDIIDLYVFDRDLRLLVVDAIERIEIAIKAAWAYHMAMKYGSHGYLKPLLYRNHRQLNDAQALLRGEIKKSKETFIEHYRKKYTHPEIPPIWMTSEILSFGQLSKWINNLISKERVALARKFRLHEEIFVSMLRVISLVRNICAHHGRLWNKRLTTEMKIPTQPHHLYTSLGGEKKKIYNALCMLKYLLNLKYMCLFESMSLLVHKLYFTLLNIHK